MGGFETYEKELFFDQTLVCPDPFFLVLTIHQSFVLPTAYLEAETAGGL